MARDAPFGLEHSSPLAAPLERPFALLPLRPPRPALPNIRYAQNNAISSLAGLERVPHLDALNVSSNLLTGLEGAAACPALNSLLADNNQLEDLAGLEPLAELQGLHTLDLQHNK